MALFDVCGVHMADIETACRIFYFPHHHDLKAAAKDGFPCVKIFDRYFYPVDLGRKYYAVKDKTSIKPEAERIASVVHKAVKSSPKEEWFRKVEDYDESRPWSA